MSEENPNRSRLQILTSHFTHHKKSAMASEKEAALLAVPSDSPTMYAFLLIFLIFMFHFSVFYNGVFLKNWFLIFSQILLPCMHFSVYLSVLCVISSVFVMGLPKNWILIFRFDKIINKEIPADIVFEDDKVCVLVMCLIFCLVFVWGVKFEPLCAVFVY